MSATHGGVVAGRDIRNSKIDTRVRTDGGAFVSGTVRVDGAHFVGRDWIDQRTIVQSLDDFVLWLVAESGT